MSNIQGKSGTENETPILETAAAPSHEEQTGAIIPDPPIHKDMIDSDVSPGGSKRMRTLQSAPGPASDGDGGCEGHDEDDDEKNLAPSTKRRKILPTRNKDGEHSQMHSHVEVIIPVKDIVEGTSNQAVVTRTETGKEKDDFVDDTIARVLDQPDEEKPQVEDEDLSKITPITEEAVAHETPDKQMQIERTTTPRSKDSPPTNPASSSKRKHKRFGSEEPPLNEVEVVPEETQQLEDEDENSDDEGPEVVARPDAQEKTRQSARNAARAIEDQEAINRRKRRAQDLRLKDQAKLSSKKRKREDATEDSKGSLRDMPMSENDLKAIASLPAKISKAKLPSFLPLEYLEDHEPSPEINEVPIVSKKVIAKGKKTKFSDSKPKKRKDLVRGSTTFRIAEAKDDGLLPPKAVYTAMALKETWLQGRGGKGSNGNVGLMRRPVNKGFLVKK